MVRDTSIQMSDLQTIKQHSTMHGASSNVFLASDKNLKTSGHVRVNGCQELARETILFGNKNNSNLLRDKDPTNSYIPHQRLTQSPVSLPSLPLPPPPPSRTAASSVPRSSGVVIYLLWRYVYCSDYVGNVVLLHRFCILKVYAQIRLYVAQWSHACLDLGHVMGVFRGNSSPHFTQLLSSMMAAVYPVCVFKVTTENARTTIYNLMVGETVFGTAICVLLAQALTQGHSLISTFPIVMWRYILSIAIGVMVGLASGKFINCILDSVCCCLIPCQRYVDFFALCAGLPVGTLFAILAMWFNITLNSPLAIFSSIVAFFYVKPTQSPRR
uniref:Uncharacterized protein n=1 Tax=Kalanchoe fedtschenkoi TaxID=63787 RepID=A0A7N0VJW7_KALFE